MSSNECDCAVPLPAEKREDLDKITIYGTWFNAPPEADKPTDVPLQHHVLAYGFAFQGHCYRLSIPAEYRFEYYSKKTAWVPQLNRDEKTGKCAPAEMGLDRDVKCVSIVTKLPKEPDCARGCGFDADLGYYMWTIDRTVPVQRIERRQGLAEELILDFNLPGRPPSTLTYSAKTAIASRAGKVHE